MLCIVNNTKNKGNPNSREGNRLQMFKRNLKITQGTLIEQNSVKRLIFFA